VILAASVFEILHRQADTQTYRTEKQTVKRRSKPYRGGGNSNK